jgi:hypothetical protein
MNDLRKRRSAREVKDVLSIIVLNREELLITKLLKSMNCLLLRFIR